MSYQQEETPGWHELPIGVQQAILVQSSSPCVRRVSKAWRDAFDTANDTLNLRGCDKHDTRKLVAAAAAARVVKNSTGLTAVSLFSEQPYAQMVPPLTVSNLLAAGAATGLATRLHKLTDIQPHAEDVVQQLQALRQCTGLTHLDFDGSQLGGWLAQHGAQGAAALPAALQAMGGLTYLRVGNCCLQSRHAAALASMLQPLTQLRHLHLPGNKLGAAGVAALAPALSAMPWLQTLDVSNNALEGAAGAEALCGVLGASPGLMHLDVRRSSLGDEGAALLAPVLRGMTCLQTLDMRHTRIGDGSIAMIGPALAALPHLHTLDLACNQFGVWAMAVLQPLWVKKGSILRKMALGCNRLDPKGAWFLASGLSSLTLLRELSLSLTASGGDALITVAPAFSRLGPSLQSLRLVSNSCNRLVLIAAAALAAALQTLTGLTDLALYQVPQSERDMAMIAPALKGMRRLQVLQLGGNPLHAEGTAALASVLPALAGSLTHLRLFHCSMDVEAVANALAPALAQATNLVGLFLDGHDFGPQGAQWLVPVLSALPHLRLVELYACKLDLQGCMAVAQALRERDGASLKLLYSALPRAGVVELLDLPGLDVYVRGPR